MGNSKSLVERLQSMFQFEDWNPGEEDFLGTSADELFSWQTKGHAFFNNYRRDKLPEGNELTAHFARYKGRENEIPLRLYYPSSWGSRKQESRQLILRPQGEIPYFDSSRYSPAPRHEEAMRLLLLPIDPAIFKHFNFSLQDTPWLSNMCNSCVQRFLYEFAKRGDVEAMAEIRSKQNVQSALLVKFDDDKKFFIFDRQIGWNMGMPEELMLGWYAQVYDGTNQKSLPNFDRYKMIYEAYHPTNFILRKDSIYIRSKA